MVSMTASTAATLPASAAALRLLRGRAGISLANQGGPGKLTTLFLRGSESDHVLVLDNTLLGDDVVASVWGRQLRVTEFDKSTIEAFVITQKDGSTTPEPGAVCTDGVGTPVA